MPLAKLNALMHTGFLAVYAAGMGSLVVGDMPLLQGYCHAILTYVLLPLGMLGLALIFYEKMQAVSGQR